MPKTQLNLPNLVQELSTAVEIVAQLLSQIIAKQQPANDDINRPVLDFEIKIENLNGLSHENFELMQARNIDYQKIKSNCDAAFNKMRALPPTRQAPLFETMFQLQYAAVFAGEGNFKKAHEAAMLAVQALTAYLINPYPDMDFFVNRVELADLRIKILKAANDYKNQIDNQQDNNYPRNINQNSFNTGNILQGLNVNSFNLTQKDDNVRQPDNNWNNDNYQQNYRQQYNKNQKKKIYGIGLDFDGCIGEKGLRPEEMIKYHQSLLNHLLSKINESPKDTCIEWFNFSNRQNKEIDENNARYHQNGSCLRVLVAIENGVKTQGLLRGDLGKNSKVNYLSLNDLFSNQPPGATFGKMLEWQNLLPNNPNASADPYPCAGISPNILDSFEDFFRNSRLIFDKKKILSVYAHLHELASKNLDCNIVYKAVDDQEPILQAIYEFFSKNTDLLPQGAKLKLHQYCSDKRGEWSRYPVIIGTGPIDFNYSFNVPLMANFALNNNDNLNATAIDVAALFKKDDGTQLQNFKQQRNCNDQQNNNFQQNTEQNVNNFADWGWGLDDSDSKQNNREFRM